MPTEAIISNVTIPRHVAQHVCWVLGDENNGLQPGSFTTHLIRALIVADPENQAKLKLGFPDYQAAVHAWQREELGMDRVLEIARGI